MGWRIVRAIMLIILTLAVGLVIYNLFDCLAVFRRIDHNIAVFDVIRSRQRVPQPRLIVCRQILIGIYCVDSYDITCPDIMRFFAKEKNSKT